MDQPSPFQPNWPPAPDEEFGDQSEVRQARRMFRLQLVNLVDLARSAVGLPSGADTCRLSDEIAALLHNISGTAAYFGKADFGIAARELEQPVRAAFTADLLRPLCATIQLKLMPEGLD